jgi:hypothetical protein
MAVQRNTRREKNYQHPPWRWLCFSVEWHFFAISHENKPADGIGGSVKKLPANENLHTQRTITKFKPIMSYSITAEATYTTLHSFMSKKNKFWTTKRNLKNYLMSSSSPAICQKAVWEQRRYSSSLSQPWHKKGVSGQQHCPATCYLQETKPQYPLHRGWVGPRASQAQDGWKIFHLRWESNSSRPDHSLVPILAELPANYLLSQLQNQELELTTV